MISIPPDSTHPSARFVHHPPRDLGHFDLIVVGGGAAGSAAAIASARLGLSVLLIDPLSFLGGTGVGAQVTPWMSNNIDMGDLNHGLSGELQRDLEVTDDARGYYINPERLKMLLERKAQDAGVRLLLESNVIAVELSPTGESQRVSGVLISTRRGLFTARCATLIDASGDAEVAHLAGVSTVEGRETDKRHQPMSLRFVLGGIDMPRFWEWCKATLAPNLFFSYKGMFVHDKITEDFRQLALKENWPEKWMKTFSIQFFQIPSRPGEFWFNCPRITGFDPLDPVAMSDAYVEGRRMIEAYVKLFTNHVGGADKCYLVAVAPMMGIREGRRIVGQYVLRADDFHQRRKFDDGICFNRYPIDIHNPTGMGVTWIEMPENDWHEIPFRCLVPENRLGLLVAGRFISSDFSAQASYRIIPNCRTLGEAAGVAGAIAKASGIDVGLVDGVEVRREMLRLGMLPTYH